MSSRTERSLIHITWLEAEAVYQVEFQTNGEASSKMLRALGEMDAERRAGDPMPELWSIHPSSIDALRELAIEHFDNAQLTEGDTTINLHTGRATQQLTLFA